MRRGSLTARLTRAAALAVILAVVVLGAGALWIVDHQMRSALDASLRQRASDVARLSVSAPAVLVAPGALEAPVAGRQLAVEVLDRRGRILARSLALGARVLPSTPAVAAALRDGRASFSDVTLGEGPARSFAAPIADLGGPAAGGAVVVAGSTQDIARTTGRLGGLIALCALLAAALGAASAALLTRRGLRPVRRLSQAAAAIERTGDASARLPEVGSADEVGELAGTLNAMLGALEEARRRERRFLADASHELRTPLTALAGNVEFVARHGLAAGVLDDLRHDAERMRRVIDDLLALEREGAAPLPRQPVRLDEIVRAAAGEAPGVEVAAASPLTILGEPSALRRALDNLLENARVHGPPGGRITVALRAVGSSAELSVRDEGPGLTGDEVELAFERFWRGPAAAGRPGSGLGLALVRATAQRHGGSVRVEGATIALRLPLVDAGDRVAEATGARSG